MVVESHETDATQPAAARMYDYYLGGKDNYAVDREAAAEVEKHYPSVSIMARTNRDFMHRSVRWLTAEAGIDQFLDIGTGIPTEPNLHQIAQEIIPDTRVVYVDNDPIVLAHARALLTSSNGRTAYIDADVRRVHDILDAPQLRETLDLSRPVALTMIALMHFVPDTAGAYEAVNTVLSMLPRGSYLVMSQATADFDPVAIGEAVRIYTQRGLTPQVRTQAEFSRFFDGLELVEPGVVPPHRWRAGIEPPQSLDAEVNFYAAVARKP
ncbi:SAM-dependent methyltransferase [Nocardia nova]|uniref:SAM-dependent methyltransferase n=1 Tax=Nocardia nova TaxID=37330 RepID=UPI00215739D7|nr:SAM-dependent methyltransferase [Nocardia nova]